MLSGEPTPIFPAEIDDSPLTVRPAIHADLDGLAHIWHVTASLHYGPIFGGPSDDFTPATCREWWTHHVDFGFVAMVRGAIVGTVYGGPESHGNLARLYVHPDSWRAGAGTALATEAEVSLSRQGFASAQLWTLEQNTLAQNFWKNRGWFDDGRRIELAPGIWDYGFTKLLKS